MKQPLTANRKSNTTTPSRIGPNVKQIHPIIIYPFSHPNDVSDIEMLYTELIAALNEDKDKYAKPITVMNRQTYYKNIKWVHNPGKKKAFEEFRNTIISAHSKILDVWSVDTCQMWLAGFGAAYDDNNTGDDVYWLIPGDFNYSSKKEVLNKMKDLPTVVFEGEQDICLGEIEVDVNSSKQLIDTYGTYGLLYNWFPHQAQQIRKITDKPRTEFFAICHSFLREILRQRWYAYEQTIIILLQAVIAKKCVHKIPLGSISDLPQGRDTLAAAMQQVERTERALKLFWRELNLSDGDWSERFKKLDAQAAQIRGAALVILENLLTYPG
jgi:hypothetical protein